MTANKYILLICVVLCFVCLRPSSADAPCPPKYPAAKLLHFCPPAPAWCKRLRGHGVRNWRRCRPGCVSQLVFGKRRYRVTWSSAKATKLPVFGLDLPGWHGRTLTIWHNKLYARRSRGKSAWKIVYPVGRGKLVAVAKSAKPPYNCGRQSVRGRNKKRGGIVPVLQRRLRGLRVRCHENQCALLLPFRRLIQQVAKLRRQSHGHRRHLTAALRFTLTARSGQAKFLGSELLLLLAPTHRRQRKRLGENNPASAYRSFLRNRRKKYWQTQKEHSKSGHVKKKARKPQSNWKKNKLNGDKPVGGDT